MMSSWVIWEAPTLHSRRVGDWDGSSCRKWVYQQWQRDDSPTLRAIKLWYRMGTQQCGREEHTIYRKKSQWGPYYSARVTGTGNTWKYGFRCGRDGSYNTGRKSRLTWLPPMVTLLCSGACCDNVKNKDQTMIKDWRTSGVQGHPYLKTAGLITVVLRVNFLDSRQIEVSCWSWGPRTCFERWTPQY